MDRVLNKYAYSKYKPNSKLVLNPARMELLDKYLSCFNDNAEWFEFYCDLKEETPSDAPLPAGNEVEIPVIPFSPQVISS